MIWYILTFLGGGVFFITALWLYDHIMDRRERRWLLSD